MDSYQHDLKADKHFMARKIDLYQYKIHAGNLSSFLTYKKKKEYQICNFYT